MALWPFGKSKKKNNAEDQAQHADQPAEDVRSAPADATDSASTAAESEQPLSVDSPAPADTPGDAAAAQGFKVTVNRHDAVNGDMGPFDGDAVDIETFDFSEFSTGILDLKSMKIPLPKRSQMQVEMGAQGPKMLHIITEFGRITPVAFAAPRSTGQWESSVNELVENIQRDGMPTQIEEGPWGTEIDAKNDNGMLHINGIEGPRWLLRLTLAAPTGKEEGLTELAREVASRVFVYRGDDPILAGNSLPVTMPPQLVKQVQDEMERRKQEQNKPQEQSQQDTSAANKAAQEAAARQLFQMLGGNAAAQAAKNSEHHPENDPEDSDTSAESDDTSGDDSEGNGDSK